MRIRGGDARGHTGVEMTSTRPPVYTIGHSTRPIDVFLDLLGESRIECVVDVRRLPGSRAFPHFDADALRAALAQGGIDYWHAVALGGRRKGAQTDDRMHDSFWTNPGFRRYAAYARTAGFNEGVRELEDRARVQRCALMCAEAVWWRCHRRIIADHLLARGHAVFHIMGSNKVVPATLTIGAVVTQGELFYPAPANELHADKPT